MRDFGKRFGRTPKTAIMTAGAVGAAFMVLSVGTADASYYYYSNGAPYYVPQPAAVAAPRPYRQPVRKSRQKTDKPAKEATERPVKGPLAIVVSTGDQRVRIYDAGGQIAEAPVSTGTQSHPTPMGVFSVIQKDRYHRSNLYFNAPMPYMQRITWSGSALHEGALPGYPASHGCVRMPSSFAAKLWGMTKLGVRVIVARSAVVPSQFSHPQLARLKKLPDQPVAALPIAGAGKTASAESSVSDAPSPGVTADPVAPSTAAPAPALPVPAAEPAAAAPAPAAPAAAATPVPATPVSSEAPASAAAPVTPAAPTPLVEYGPPRPVKPGPVSIFASKKEGKLFVRKGFEPIYEIPIKFAQPELPLGTHVFTATDVEQDGQTLRWNVMSLPPELRAEVTSGPRGRNAKAAKPAAVPAPAHATTPAEALDRLDIPAEAVQRLAEWMSTGASLVVSDKGLGPETGRGTDFIVLSR